MADPAETAETTDVVPAKKSKKKLFIIVGLVVLLAGGAGAWMMMQGSSDGEEAHAAQPKPPVFLALDTFTVNLLGGEQYLQTDITLQIAAPDQLELIKLHMPRVRSRLLALLSSKQAAELETVEDKHNLAREIMAQLSLPFYTQGQPQKIEDVLFTSFVIQ